MQSYTESSVLLSYRNDRNLFLISSFSLKTNYAVCQGKQCIVFSTSNVYTRMDLGATLSVKDIASFYKLSVSSFCS